MAGAVPLLKSHQPYLLRELRKNDSGRSLRKMLETAMHSAGLRLGIMKEDPSSSQRISSHKSTWFKAAQAPAGPTTTREFRTQRECRSSVSK
jgi:hypothetical protein